MLKNRKAIYVLIPLNIFIWGFFAYRFYSAYSGAEEPVYEHRAEVKLVEFQDTSVYRLQLDYKDPFLKQQRSQVSSPPPTVLVKSPVAVSIPSATPAQTPVAPDIRFMGLVKNNSNGTITALVSVNGQSRLVKSNETIDGVTIKTVYHDSLVARWGKEKLVIRR